jgi:hypothetical protein
MELAHRVASFVTKENPMRTYAITVTCTDVLNATTTADVVVTVLHDLGN